MSAETLAEIARVERQAREKLEEEAKAARDREAVRQAREAEEAARAAAAPDREKLIAFAAMLDAIQLPEFETAQGRAAGTDIAIQLGDLTSLIRAKGVSL